jgi:WhiB family transcriptional regulator, redox-sensing transcriptional regulator
VTNTRVLGSLPCQHSPDLFFAQAPDDIRLAKTLCRHCPVQPACLDDALQRRELWGIWGGALFERGVIIADKRRRGRPAKEAISPPTAARASPPTAALSGRRP